MFYWFPPLLSLSIFFTVGTSHKLVGQRSVTDFIRTLTLVSGMNTEWEKNILIPEYVKPVDYDIFIHPNLNDGTFSGTVSIGVNITKPWSYIPVHIKNLKVIKSSLVFNDGSAVAVETSHCVKNQFWVLIPKEEVSVLGLYTINLTFEGTLTGKNVGLYRSVYIKGIEER